MTQNEIEEMDAEESSRMYELYRMECELQKVEPSVRDFMVWLQERD